MVVVTPSTIDPLSVVSAADLDAWSNDVRGPSDSRSESFIKAAFTHVEAALNRAVLRQTRRSITRIYPLSTLRVEPFESVTVTRVDADGTETTVDNDQFVLDGDAGNIDPRTDALYYGESFQGYGGPYFPWLDYTWFSDQRRYHFDYVCGWTVDELPEEVRLMVLGYAAHIARFRAMPTSDHQYVKEMKRLCSRFRIAAVVQPAWVMT